MLGVAGSFEPSPKILWTAISFNISINSRIRDLPKVPGSVGVSLQSLVQVVHLTRPRHLMRPFLYGLGFLIILNGLRPNVDAKNVVIGIGDWSQHELRKFKEPLKGKGFRTTLRRASYTELLVDEYRTSINLAHLKHALS